MQAYVEVVKLSNLANAPLLKREEARRLMREAEDAFVAGRSRQWKVTKALEQRQQRRESKGKQKTPNKAVEQAKQLPDGCIDLLVEDHQAEEEERMLDRCVTLE